MNNPWIVLAAALSLAAAGTAYAQGRHDDKPHGQGKASPAPDTPVTARTPGRHDDRPHGPAKAKAAKKAPAKKAEARKEESKEAMK